MQRARVSNHPCHRLSVPAAKRFWCRHCMMVFEDAITRWRHSRSCRSGGFDNFVRRREIETQALQKMAETLDPEMVTPVAVPSGEGGAGCSKELCCFICRQRFISLDEMREHVKYPCNKPASLQRPSMTVYIEEPTFGTGIQQHYTDGPASQSQYQQESSSSTAPAVSASASSPHPVTVYMNDSEQGHQDNEAKPTNIYVNEKGETVIEVENLDLSTKSGELSLAHLLTQLSQQGIVFDQQPQGETEGSAGHQEPQIVQDTAQEVDYSQPTAVDAANTLTQLAGSAFRATSNPQDTYAYVPALKRIKTEGAELQYPLEQQEHMPSQPYLKTEEPAEQPDQEKYIICTNDSEVISVVRADDVSPENSSSGVVYQNGPVLTVNDPSGSSHIQATLEEANAEETVIFQGQSNQDSRTVVVHSTENGTAEASFAGTSMIVLQDQPQVHAAPAGQMIKSEDPSDQVVITTHNESGVEQTGELTAVPPYHSEENATVLIESVDISHEEEEAKSCHVISASSQATTTLTSGNAVTGLLQSSGEPAIMKIPETAQVDLAAESALLLPQIVSVTSSSSDGHQVILQHQQNTGMVALPSIGNPLFVNSVPY